MPEEITLEDGTKREVPTEEEQKAFTENATKLEEQGKVIESINALKESLKLGEGQTLEDKVKEMEESSNPDWKKTRTLIKNLKQSAKDKGVEVDDEGNVSEKKELLTKEDMEKTAQETYNKIANDANKAKILKGFSEEDSKSIGEIFDRLQSVGGKFGDNMEMAIKQVLPDQPDAFKEALNSSGGGAPRQAAAKGSTSMSNDAKTIGVDKFGLTQEDFDRVN